jgi:hypothetical protein
MWNLKLSWGSKNTPRYFIAGTGSFEKTCVNLKTLRGSFWDRLLLLINIDAIGEVLADDTTMNLVLSGCNDSPCSLKKLHIR